VKAFAGLLYEPRVPSRPRGSLCETEEGSLKREDKARVIENLAEKLRGSSVVLVDYKGMNVAQSTQLRARSREAGIEFVVAKNTLAQRAANQAGVEGLNQFLVGPTAIAFAEDPVVGASSLTRWRPLKSREVSLMVAGSWEPRTWWLSASCPAESSSSRNCSALYKPLSLGW